MGCSAKGPTSWAVSPIATPAVIAIDSVAPGGPSRKAAQISAGKTAYLIGSSVENARTLSAVTPAITAAPSQVRMRRQAPTGSRAHASIRGRTTSPPELSASHQVRQNSAAPDSSTTPPATIETVPTVALIAVATPMATSMPPTCSTRSIAAFGPMSRRSNSAPTTISAMLPACWPSRLPMGNALSSSNSSPLTTNSARSTPGHQRRPHR